ncbi:Eco57I restriction-modification methylase domain-containing protein [Parafrankia sp. FMc2]|uniref:Eco57I restriction-modification methylase domain-containing protein n=1 Tax=Parafrankia sp. FMc2 TaxID=3233196 RepID=UPI0034D580F2
MDKQTRGAIESATRRARRLLEEDFAFQLDGKFDIRRDAVADAPGAHLNPRQVFQRERIMAALGHKQAAGMSVADAVTDYVRDAAFTTLNRFVALKMLERRGLVQTCVSKGEESQGFEEFCLLAPGLPLLPESAGYRLYIESLFDELSTEVKVLFDRRDPASVLWPRRAAFEELLGSINDPSLDGVWGEDETIGWVYQYFNSADERRQMRDESQAPRNSRELAIRNQFFTPRYVVQFLTDNTLGRIWYEMRGTKTTLAEKCEYMVRRPGETFAPRTKKDPRDLRILDPACGSGHFLLYAFDLLVTIYEEAYVDPASPASDDTGCRLAEDYADLAELRAALPGLVLRHNLHGVDIDPRCAQIAQLALWLRAQRAYDDFEVGRSARLPIRRTNVILAEPLVADGGIAKDFLDRLENKELAAAFIEFKDELALAGDLGVLLRIEKRRAVLAPGYESDLFTAEGDPLRKALDSYSKDEVTRANTRRRLFADDATQGLGLLDLTSKKYDVVLMNPPFGAPSVHAKKIFEQAYLRTKIDIYAAFVERGIELLSSRGRLGAITSRTGFFLSRFQAWREEILLKTAPPAVVADLGPGVLDSAMVETAAYCLELAS